MKTGREEIDEYDTEGYRLKKDSLGVILTNTFEATNRKGESEGLITYEIAEFDDIKKLDVDFFDVVNNKQIMGTEFLICIKGEDNIAKTSIECKNLLHKSKRGYKTKVDRPVERFFVNELNDMKSKKVKHVCCFGFINNKNIEYPEYNIVEDDVIKRPTVDYSDFINCKYDKDKIEPLIEKINNKLARCIDEAKIMKIIVAWSISSYIKFELKRLGIRIFPMLVIIGDKGIGKTTALEIFVSKLWNTILLTPQYFEGSQGARIGNLNNDTRPVLVDEKNNFDSWVEILKNSTIKGYIEIPKGTKTGKVKNLRKYFNLCIATNQFNVVDSAFAERIISFTYEDFGDAKLSGEELGNIVDDVKHLGFFIKESLPNWGIESLYRYYSSLYQNKNPRTRDKLITLRIGLDLCDEIGLFPQIKEIKDEELISHNNKSIVSINDVLHDIIKVIVNNTEVRGVTKVDVRQYTDGSEHDITLQLGNFNLIRVFSKKFINDQIYSFFASKGLFIRKGFTGIAISSAILPLINQELKRRGLSLHLKDLKQLGEQLRINYEKNATVGVLKLFDDELEFEKSTSIRGISIYEQKQIIEDFVEEQEKLEVENE